MSIWGSPGMRGAGNGFDLLSKKSKTEQNGKLSGKRHFPRSSKNFSIFE